tara:strand:+ start:1340 stop:1630 length:291 start_codon:yes stop_codon:yes gene_type:complete
MNKYEIENIEKHRKELITENIKLKAVIEKLLIDKKALQEQLTLTDVVKSLPNKEEINLAANKCSDVNGIICADEYWIIAKNDGFKEGVEWLINRLK